MQSVLVVVHLFLAIGLVGLILIQHGKGADMGAAFGSGASASVFGARGASNFLSRTTGILAALFFVTSLALAYFAMQSTEPETLMQGVQPAAVEVVEPEVPVVVDLPTVPEVPAPVPAPAADAVPQVTE
jgi:preprotein translocase subunit SecG